jgi:hypothetical protein
MKSMAESPQLNDAFQRLADAEARFLSSEFLAPVVRGSQVQVRIAGVVCTLRVQPTDFEGWGVFRPTSHTEAKLARQARLAERQRFLELFPLVRMLVARRHEHDWLALPAHRGDTRFYIDGMVPVRLIQDAQLFETIHTHFFRATGVEIDAIRKELTDRNAGSLLQGAGLVVDTFDNSSSRRIVQEQCRALSFPCLHAGLYADYGEVIWDENYRVPRDVAGDVCDYPLARNLVLLVVAIASEVILAEVLHGRRQNWSATLGDFAVRPLEQ